MKAVSGGREREKGGHVLRGTTSRGSCVIHRGSPTRPGVISFITSGCTYGHDAP